MAAGLTCRSALTAICTASRKGCGSVTRTENHVRAGQLESIGKRHNAATRAWTAADHLLWAKVLIDCAIRQLFRAAAPSHQQPSRFGLGFALLRDVRRSLPLVQQPLDFFHFTRCFPVSQIISHGLL